MIARKYHRLVFSFFMSFLMSGIMSFVISIFNLGFIDGILFIWLKAWGFAFTIAFPTIILVSPIVFKLVELVLTKEPETKP
ncbi:DUF2798 domain-containing protein [Thalassotalea agariperforans]